MAEHVRGPTVLVDSRSGTFTARPERVPQLDQTEYQSTGVYNALEDILRAKGRCVTVSFLLLTLFYDTLGLPSGTYIECPRPLGWNTNR